MQVMGKLRGTIAVPPDAPAEAVIAAAEAEPNVARALAGKRDRQARSTCRTGSSTSWSRDEAGGGLLALAAGASLSGCGFQPVYMPTASGKAGVAQRELAAIQVDLIPDRPGQLLRQALQDRLERSASGVAQRYDLAVAFGIAGEGIAIQPDNTATRIREIGSANWTLVAQDPGTHAG